jgi:hypothetical protein
VALGLGQADSATIVLSGPNHCEGDKAVAFKGAPYFTEDVEGLWQRPKTEWRVLKELTPVFQRNIAKTSAKICYPAFNELLSRTVE